MKKVNVRKALLKELSQIPAGSKVAILLSAGIDSASVLFAALELDLKVKAYTFVLQHQNSTDSQGALSVAKTFNVPCEVIVLPRSVDTLVADIKVLAKEYQCKKKTEFECTWPMLYAYKAIKEKYILSGLAADGHFCLSKKGMMHWKDRIDEFRKSLFSAPNYAQKVQHALLCKKFKKTHVIPYLGKSMQTTIAGTTWTEANKPKQKQLILDSYPEHFAKMRVRQHTNFQMGDSGLQDHYKQLLQHPEFKHLGFKSVVGIFNTVNKNC